MSDEDQASEAFESIRQLYAYEGNATWSRYNAMLTANSIIVATMGLFWNKSEPLMAVVLIAAGLIACVLWAQLTHIGFRMQQEYLTWAKEFEVHKAEAARIFTRAANVCHGSLGVTRCAGLIIGLFVIIYVCAAVLLLSSIFRFIAVSV